MDQMTATHLPKAPTPSATRPPLPRGEFHDDYLTAALTPIADLPGLPGPAIEGYAARAAEGIEDLVSGIENFLADQESLEDLGPRLLDAFARERVEGLDEALAAALLHAAGAGILSAAAEGRSEKEEGKNATASDLLNSTFDIFNSATAATTPAKPFTPEEAVNWFKRKVPLPDAAYRDLTDRTKAHAFTIGGFTSQKLLVDLHQSIEEALASGQTFGAWRAGVRGTLAAGGWTSGDERYLRLVFDQAMTSAYQVERWKMQQAAIEFAPYGRYRTVGDERVRPEHAALDGRVWRLDDPIWDTIYPPNGWRCRCYVETLSQRQFDKQGLRLSESAGIEQNVDPKFRYNPAKGPTGEQLDEIFRTMQTKDLIGWERYGLAKELSTKRPVPADTPPHPEYLRKQGLSLDDVVERYRVDFTEIWAMWDGTDFAGNGMTLAPDFFEHLVGLDTGNVTWDRVKRGRWSRAALEALKDPEEFWLSLHIDVVDGKEKRNLRRYYLATFTDEKDRLIAVFATVDPGTRTMVFNILPMTQVRQMNKQMRSGVLLWRDPKAGKGTP